MKNLILKYENELKYLTPKMYDNNLNREERVVIIEKVNMINEFLRELNLIK